jgi:LysM repeat protein
MEFQAAGIMQKMKWKLGTFFWLVSLVALAGCTAGEISLPTIVPLPTDTPVIASTPSATFLPANTIEPSSTPTPSPTPTPAPVTYTVTENDDMFGVALRYGITLDALKAANPTVIPNLMSVGTVLIIPVTPTPVSIGTSQQNPTPTPDPFNPLRMAAEPVCYQDALGGAYCFVLLENVSDSPAENPSVRFTLTGNDATTLEMDGILPLNILPAQETLPALAYFPAPIPESFEVRAQITDWLPVMVDDTRYLETEIVAEPPAIAPGTGFTEAVGVVNVPDGEAEYVWVLGVVYDKDGQVLGLRRWEAEVPLATSNSIPFDFRVYALQGEIAELKLFVESHASIP